MQQRHEQWQPRLLNNHKHSIFMHKLKNYIGDFDGCIQALYEADALVSK